MARRHDIMSFDLYKRNCNTLNHNIKESKMTTFSYDIQRCLYAFFWVIPRHLTEFLNHLNRLHNKIQFTMEIEEGRLPFLDNDIYRKTNGSLGHEVYRKPTHTNLYQHQNSHHHPANKQSVLASLIQSQSSLWWRFPHPRTGISHHCLQGQWIQPSTDTTSHGTGNMDRQDQWFTHLDCIHTIHPNNIWPPQQNAGQTQHQKCRPTTYKNIQLLSTSQGCIGIKNNGCIQQPMWMRQGLHWTKRSIYPTLNQRAQQTYKTGTTQQICSSGTQL